MGNESSITELPEALVGSEPVGFRVLQVRSAVVVCWTGLHC